jgi:hypothetical protein
MSQSSSIVSSVAARLPRVLAVLTVLAACLLLLACGGSGPGANAAAQEQSKEHTAELKLAKFAKCMREHGISATASSGPGGHGLGLKLGVRVGGPVSRQTMEGAQRACKRYQPEPEKINLSPQEKVQHEEAVLKFAKCMREHGVEVHASSSEGRIEIQIRGRPGSGGPNPESPAFQAAQKSCQGLLPAKRGAGASTSKGAGPGPGLAIGG